METKRDSAKWRQTGFFDHAYQVFAPEHYSTITFKRFAQAFYKSLDQTLHIKKAGDHYTIYQSDQVVALVQDQTVSFEADKTNIYRFDLSDKQSTVCYDHLNQKCLQIYHPNPQAGGWGNIRTFSEVTEHEWDSLLFAGLFLKRKQMLSCVYTLGLIITLILMALIFIRITV